MFYDNSKKTSSFLILSAVRASEVSLRQIIPFFLNLDGGGHSTARSQLSAPVIKANICSIESYSMNKSFKLSLFSYFSNDLLNFSMAT
jgi:hypothetical protein